ncbi:glycosyltransferase family 4 protein [Mycoplasmatota bacterium]|nr:glycosyltransferase family 4 protein [Mycoplasmatota bacterium]
MKKKKIALHIIMPNQVSGPNTANRRMAQSWMKNIYDFEFVNQTFLAKSKINLRLIKDLKRQFSELNPDLVHLSGLQSSGFHAIVAARLAGCKNILITIRGFSGDSIGINPLKRFIFNKIIEPLTLRMCTKFYTVCEEAASRKMVQKYKKKYIGVIHNAAPDIDFGVKKTGSIFRHEIDASEDDFLVVISGRMVYDKGISFISEAIDKIHDPKIKFVFIGDGEYHEILRKKHENLVQKERVVLLGKRSDVLNILSGCDLFLFATLHENLSNALLEAMAVGLPVVATRIGGNVEVVEDGKNGFLIPPKNVAEIVRCIKLIKNDKKLKNNFSSHSERIIREKFSQERLYKTLSEVYESLYIE